MRWFSAQFHPPAKADHLTDPDAMGVGGADAPSRRSATACTLAMEALGKG